MCSVRGLECRLQGLTSSACAASMPATWISVEVDLRGEGKGFRVQGAGCRVQGAGFRVQGSGFRVQGAGFRVQGSGFRVYRIGVRPLHGGRRRHVRGARLYQGES